MIHGEESVNRSGESSDIVTALKREITFDVWCVLGE